MPSSESAVSLVTSGIAYLRVDAWRRVASSYRRQTAAILGDAASPARRFTRVGRHGSGVSRHGRLERVQLVLAGLDDAPAGLRHLVPDAGDLAERLRDDEPRLLVEVGEAR